MKNEAYQMATLDEYFELVEKENKKRAQMISKSLAKYLQKNHTANKYAELMKANIA